MHGVWGAIVQWDRDTFAAINGGLQCRFLDVVMPPISDLGLGHIQVLGVLAVALIIALHRREIRLRRFLKDAWSAMGRRRGWLVPLFIAWAFSGILSTVVKNSMSRDRPTWFYEQEQSAGRSLDVRVHTIPGRRPLQTRGFLSGHTATSVALATAFTLIGRRRKWSRYWALASWLIALMVSFSRIYIADHWPLDVVGGVVLGLLCGFAAVAVSGGRDAKTRPEPLHDEGPESNSIHRAAGSA